MNIQLEYVALCLECSSAILMDVKMTFNRCFLQCLRFRMYVNLIIKCLLDDFKQSVQKTLKVHSVFFSSLKLYTETYVYNHVHSHGIVV